MLEVKKKKVSVFITLCAIYLFCTPLDFLPIIPNVSFSVSKILVLLPLLGAALELGEFSKADKKAFPLFLYFIVVAATMVYTINRGKSLDRFISVGLNTILIFILSLRKYSEEELKYLLKAYVYSAWFVLALLVMYADFDSNSGRMTIMVNGQEQDPNYLTGYFTFSICYYLWGFIQQKKESYLIYSILFFVPIFLTGSRGGLLANGLAVFLLLFLGRKKINFAATMTVAMAVGLLLVIVWGFLPEEITIRYSLEFTQNDGGAQRFEIWKSCWEKFKQASILRKFFGFGAGTIRHLNYKGGVAHNLFIEFLLEYGIVGALVLIGMLVYYIVLAYRNKEYYIVAAFIGYIVMMMSLSLFSYKPMWNVLLFIILAHKVRSTIDNNNENSPVINLRDLN